MGNQNPSTARRGSGNCNEMNELRLGKLGEKIPPNFFCHFFIFLRTVSGLRPPAILRLASC